MIKTLRITSVIAVLFAVGMLSLPVVYGVKPDPAVAELLSSPSVVEQFRQAKSQGASADGQTSPLVKQAEAFALYLNPPPPPPAQAPVVQTPVKAEPQPLAQITPKFDLIGTSVHATQSELSLALIDEPGAGLRWVRLGGTIDRFSLDQVGQGRVVLRDGDKTLELTMTKDQQPAAGLPTVAQTPAKPDQQPPAAVVPPAIASRPRTRTRPSASRTQPTSPASPKTIPAQGQTPPPASEQINPQDKAMLDSMLADLEKLATSKDGEAKTPAGLTREQAMDKILSRLESVRTGPNAPAPAPLPSPEPNTPAPDPNNPEK